jgi:hypothetical protein
LHLAAPLEDGSYLLFHRCTVKSSLFNLDHMISKENKEFASSIATLDMEPGEPYPINLESDEAQQILQHFTSDTTKAPQKT